MWAVIIYIHTYNSQIEAMPTQLIVEKAYIVGSRLPLDPQVLETWQEGHKRFQPFLIGQKL